MQDHRKNSHKDKALHVVNAKLRVLMVVEI